MGRRSAALRKLTIGHVPTSKHYRPATCRRCGLEPVVYRKHYCRTCEAGTYHTIRKVSRPTAERKCRLCGERMVIDDFRAERIAPDIPRLRHRPICFRCEVRQNEADFAQLSPYHRGVIEVERASGLPAKRWIYGDNDWNDLHYERMVFHAGMRLPHGWRPLSPLFGLSMPAIVLYVEPEEQDA